MTRICVVGAGAWGTALALHCARAGHSVTLWARNPDPIVATRKNPRLPGIVLSDSVEVSADLPPAADAILLVTPVQHLRAALALQLPAAPMVLCMKGLETGTNLFPAEIAARGAAILTGPNFAHELARGLPAAAVLASADPAVRGHLLPLLGSREYRLYGSADPVGAQVGGAAKNVIAIAAGIAIGAGPGGERACRAGHARGGGDRAAGRGARRAGGDGERAVRPGGPGADLQRRQQPQLPPGPGHRPGVTRRRRPARRSGPRWRAWRPLPPCWPGRAAPCPARSSPGWRPCWPGRRTWRRAMAALLDRPGADE